MFIFKVPENKNHVKSSLTTEFIFNLNAMIDEIENRQVTNPKRKRTKTTVTHENTLSRDRVGIAEKCSDDAMPCNNINCRWVQYLHYFYANKYGYWLLPAVTQNDHCEVCRLVNSGLNKMSDFQLSKDLKVCVGGKTIN